MKAVTHLEKVIAGETSAVTHLEKVIAQEATAVTYTEKVIVGTAPPITHLQKVIAGVERPVTHLEYVWAGGSPPSVQEYTGAVPVTFIADGTPLLDYIISGNTTQSGTPTPDSPVMPQGTGERTGNLWNNGDVTIALHERYKGIPISLEQGTYTLSFEYKSVNTGAVTVIFYNESTIIQAFNITITNDKGNVSITSEQPITTIRLYSASGYAPSYDYAAEYTKIMLNLGSTALPYEPFGYKIPISSASTITPVYLGGVETTRRIKKLVLTGQESWSISGSGDAARFYINLADAIGSSNLYCTHFAEGVQTTSGNCEITASKNLAFNNSGIATKTQNWKAWLQDEYAAGTPVTIWYVLAEPETGIANEPLMKIGDYSDTLSMGQAGVSIPTANGSTTLDVETTVPPSEVYIKYHGEAVATLSALPAEVSSPEATTEEESPEETEETGNGSENVSL